MTTKKILILPALLILQLLTYAQTENDDFIYQYSSKQGFLEKEYDGNVTLDEVKKYGDFGLGTINGVDGEVVIYEKTFYRIDTEGKVKELNLSNKTPFVVLKDFAADTALNINNKTTLTELKNIIDNLKTDQPFAVKITGKFSKLKSRSVYKQSKPYPTLAEIVKNQVEFNFENTDAVIIGFWYPEYLDGANFPGYHLHCLVKDNKGGGHLLDCEILNAKVELDISEGLIIDY
ncbi:MAG: acetolactate decarboxylase [Ignavibacteria bacterium]|jgi:acetolactate decarboxylase